ncbi:undecaprenyldiphospho-muramoylpentapeptide beta-N-acetylglucosaminyltransferase [Nitratifractor sp.]
MGAIVMTGGGTGGHLAIVRSVKESLRDQALVYIGSESGQDRRWFGNDRDFAARYFLPTRGVVNRGAVGKAAALWNMAGATFRAMQLLRRHQARVVFSVGGYSAAPAAFAAVLTGVPLVIHEQNAVPGTLNRILRKKARYFLSPYEEKSPVRSYPVALRFFESARIRKKVRTILFLGGSQGAAAINELALELAPRLAERKIAILHQAGERHKESISKRYEDLGIEAEVFGFTDEMEALMNRADFAIARAGASTLWELAANGLPALFIPYPYAAGDHQNHNARYLADRQMGWVMRESAIDTKRILEIFDKDLETTSRRLMESTPRNGAEEIAQILRTI